MGIPPMKPEHAAEFLEHLRQADEILAQHLGSKHPVRLELEKVYRRIQQFTKKD